MVQMNERAIYGFCAGRCVFVCVWESILALLEGNRTDVESFPIHMVFFSLLCIRVRKVVVHLSRGPAHIAFTLYSRYHALTH